MSKSKLYRKSEFGKALLDQLDKGYDADRIAKWAYQIYLDHDMEAELDKIVEEVSAMDSDPPNFVIPEQELRRLAVRLMES